MTPDDASSILLLKAAVVGLSAVSVTLFYMLIKAKDDVTASKNEVIAATKEIIPATHGLVRSVAAIEKITAWFENKRQPS